MRVTPVKAQSRTYGYSLKIVQGEVPSHITSNPFLWYKYKRDAQAKANEINARGTV